MAKILVIDDDVMIRNAVERMLKSRGFEVCLAADGRAGVETFHREQPDLVITDIIMPDKEGFQLIMELRRAQPQVKVIAMSGGGRAGSGEFLEMAKRLGAADIIGKPFLVEDLLSRVNACLSAGNHAAPK